MKLDSWGKGKLGDVPSLGRRRLSSPDSVDWGYPHLGTGGSQMGSLTPLGRSSECLKISVMARGEGTLLPVVLVVR